MGSAGTPGVQISIAVDDRPVLTRCWGVADRERATRMDERTRFRVASLSKPVAALVMLRLIARGVFMLDESVTDLVRSGVAGVCPDAVTVRGLMSHSAGLALTQPPHMDIGVALPSVADMLSGRCGQEFVPWFDRHAPSPIRALYTGAGSMLLNHAIEQRTGRGFAEVSDELVFTPLGMRASTFDPAARRSAGISAEHGADGKVLAVTHSPGVASTGLVTTTRDIALAGQELMLAAKGLRPDFLPTGLARDGLTPQPGGHADAEFTLTHFVFRREPFTLTHGGARPGHWSTVSLFPRHGFTAAVATNSSHGVEAVKPWLGLLGAMATARGERPPWL